MVKKTFLYIFIYTLLVGCDTLILNDECITDCFLDMFWGDNVHNSQFFIQILDFSVKAILNVCELKKALCSKKNKKQQFPIKAILL